MIKILGAGLSGLSAAINLKLAGKDVTIFEKKKGIGGHIKPNFQALRCDFKTPKEYLLGLNLNPKYKYYDFSKAFFLTRTRCIDIKLSQSVHFVSRGGARFIRIWIVYAGTKTWR